MAVVTFDFDDTLTQTQWDNEEECFVFMGPNDSMCQVLRERLVEGDEVHIVTSRIGPAMSDEGHVLHGGQPSVRSFLQEHMSDVMNQIQVHFTGGVLKWALLAELDSSLHFDDDIVEIEALPPGCRGVLVKTLHGFE